MSERVSSEHSSVSTYRAELVRHGPTRRPLVQLPAEVDIDATLVRVVIEEAEYFAPVQSRSQGPRFLGAYDNARLAREREGTDRLTEWVSETALELGRSVAVDVLTPHDRYGLRQPGSRTVYEVHDHPSQSLRDIASDLGSE